MALKIRLSRGGSKKRPFYRIVVAEAASPRDGRYVERVGHYNPMVPKEHENRLSVNGERVKFWMDKGAQPTDRVHKLLSLVDILKAPEIRDQPKKSAIGKKRAEREAEAAEAKKTKKKYAIRDSNPENLLGRQKCYPYTNGVFFSRAAPMGAQRSIGENPLIRGISTI